MKLLRSKLSRKNEIDVDIFQKKNIKNQKKKLKRDVKMILKTQQKFKSKSCNVSTE